MKQDTLIDRLLLSANPAVQYKARLNILGEDPESSTMEKLRSSIKGSHAVKELLSERRGGGRLPYHPYGKWYGPHWVLTDLADIFYPAGDKSLVPLREQEYEWLFAKSHIATAPFTGKRIGIRFSPNRPRIHASMEGNAVFSLLRLGLSDRKTEELVERLLATRWPDGGWNCDRRPPPANPTISSFHETITPLRALALHARMTKSPKSRDAVAKASEIFLKRKMFKRLKNDQTIEPSFTKLHYPPYWHYDILMGLKVMAEAGLIRDKRCSEALDLLESKRLADGGFPSEAKYYNTNMKNRAALSLVDWGGVSSKRMNEFVTVDALYVLNASNRL